MLIFPDPARATTEQLLAVTEWLAPLLTEVEARAPGPAEDEVAYKLAIAVAIWKAIEPELERRALDVIGEGLDQILDEGDDTAQ